MDGDGEKNSCNSVVATHWVHRSAAKSDEGGDTTAVERFWEEETRNEAPRAAGLIDQEKQVDRSIDVTRPGRRA